jgi:hypothetical protein
METMATMIVTALVKGLVDRVAQDTYQLLKGMILRKYASAKVSIAQLEAAPESKARQAVVEEDLRMAGADQDEEVLALAKLLLETIEDGRDKSQPQESTVTLKPEDLIERADRKAGTQAVGHIMEQHVNTVIAARSQYPLSDYDLLSLRLVNNHSVPQSIRAEVGRLQMKIRVIIEEVALRIEERKYGSSEQEIERMSLGYTERQKASALVKADKQAHTSYQALKVTVELFSDLNQLIVEKINNVTSPQAEANLVLGNAILVYELTDFVIRFIENFVIQGIPDILSLHEETKKKIVDQRQQEEQLRKRIENLDDSVKEPMLNNIRARERSIEVLETEWSSYIETINSLRGGIGAIQTKIPTLEAIRENAKLQINLVQTVAMLQVLKQNIGAMQSTILSLERIQLVSLSPNRVRRLLGIDG